MLTDSVNMEHMKNANVDLGCCCITAMTMMFVFMGDGCMCAWDGGGGVL